MKVINETPYRVGHTIWMYTPGQPFMAVFVKGTYRLVDGGPGFPLPEQEQAWIGKQVNFIDEHGNSFKSPSDNVPFKRQGECFFIGSAHAPRGEPAGAVEVTFSVGTLSKRLNVFGPRRWVREGDGSARLTDPEPFTETPIRAEYAHGGPGSKYNEHGIGFGTLGKAPGDFVPAANVMFPEQIGISWERDVPWAGFGMLAPNMLPRKALLGTHDNTWRLRRRPLPPDDFDPLFFNAAPEDQRLDGYLKGDEAIVLHNLHPDKPAFQSALPGTVVRSFVHHRPDRKYPDETEFAEVATVLDTCIVNVPEETLTLVWRGTLEIHNRFHGHIDHILIVEEPVGQHKPATVYAAALKDRLRDKSGEIARAQEEERNKQLAAIDKEGLAAAIAVLKQSGAKEDLIAKFEKLDTIEEAQELMAQEVEKLMTAAKSQGDD